MYKNEIAFLSQNPTTKHITVLTGFQISFGQLHPFSFAHKSFEQNITLWTKKSTTNHKAKQ